MQINSKENKGMMTFFLMALIVGWFLNGFTLSDNVAFSG